MKYADGVVCALGVQHWCFPSTLSISDWAAWAQAIGSLLAVAAAIGLVAWQLEHVRRSEKAKQVQGLRVLWTLVYHCRVEIAYVASIFAQDKTAPFSLPSGLSHKVSALRTVPALEMPDGSVAIAVLTAIEAYGDFSAGTAPTVGPPPLTGRRYADRVESYCNAALLNFEFAETCLRLALKERNADIESAPYSINGKPYPPLEAA